MPIARDGGCYYADGAYCKSLADILMAHMRDEEWWREAAMSSEVIISPTVVERGSEDITMGENTSDEELPTSVECEEAQKGDGEERECDTVWSTGTIIGVIAVGVYCALSFGVLVTMAVRKIAQNRKAKRITISQGEAPTEMNNNES